MAEVRGLISVLLVGALLAALLFLCRRSGLLTWLAAWLLSSREEKVGLTRSKGTYNANGYLVGSNSDIHLDMTNGSFQRFDTIDRDYRLFGESTLSGARYNLWGAPISPAAPDIPPQPLRPAPAPFLPPKPPDESPPEPNHAVPRPAPSQLQRNFPLIPPPPPKTPKVTSILPPPSFADPVPQTTESEDEGGVVAKPVPAIVKESSVEELPPSSALKRAVSCDSLSSDTSVVLEHLEEPNVTGYLCIGLEYDKTLCGSDMSDLVVSVLEAKDLTGPDPTQQIDSYVRVYLLPDKSSSLQTRVYKNSNSPTYKEKFVLGMETAELIRRSLVFYVYSSDKQSNTLIGEAELRLSDVTMRQPVTTWLTLTDTGQRGTEFGELMFSLSYLPTAERLTVVVVKARNLHFPLTGETGDSFVKVYLLQHGKKVHKKKTSTKKSERSPIFNEAMIFSVPAHSLQTIQLRLTVAENTGEPRALSVGHVIVGSQASGKALSHWNQMLTSLRKPIAMWHPLRK
ncbi:synaptotagmin-12 [Neocloeon triangulifer]|uniref:synaptotagmin-12 n=1 Tax=Neocloeon triangulifer TaxID=2078957 RepID=UPI00286EC3A0|nr:synaptotagmin-12 [Neocloeon triangulifer]